MKRNKLPPLRLVGHFIRLHGYKGDLVLALEQGDPEEVGSSPYLFVELEGRPVPFRCTGTKMKQGDLIVHLEAIESDQHAGHLLQSAVYAESRRVRREEAMPEWWDLEGFAARSESDGPLGRIVEVLEYPMQFLARCVVNGKDVLIPLHEGTVIDLDEEERTVTFRLPEGLLDVYLQPDDGSERAAEEGVG